MTITNLIKQVEIWTVVVYDFLLTGMWYIGLDESGNIVEEWA